MILNPWWEVPPSITKEVAGKPGFVAVKGDNGKILRWRQPPGPRNALGQIKFVMYNPHNIYLHDTTPEAALQQPGARLQPRLHPHRAYPALASSGERSVPAGRRSDGGDDAWTPEQIAQTVASKKTVAGELPEAAPGVHRLHVTRPPCTDGSIKDYADIYKRDAQGHCGAE